MEHPQTASAHHVEKMLKPLPREAEGLSGKFHPYLRKRLFQSWKHWFCWLAATDYREQHPSKLVRVRLVRCAGARHFQRHATTSDDFNALTREFAEVFEDITRFNVVGKGRNKLELHWNFSYIYILHGREENFNCGTNVRELFSPAFPSFIEWRLMAR